MHSRQHLVTPLAAVAAGLLAGAVGTIALDAVHYLQHRRAGGKESPLAWDLGAHLAYGASTGTAFWLLTRQGEDSGT